MTEIVQKYRDGLNKLDVKRLDKVLAMYKVLRPRNYFRVVDDIAKDKKLTDEAKERLKRKAYEVLDGKQRLHTIIEFVQGKFSVQGKYFVDLSAEDTKFFMTNQLNKN